MILTQYMPHNTGVRTGWQGNDKRELFSQLYSFTTSAVVEQFLQEIDKQIHFFLFGTNRKSGTIANVMVTVHILENVI